MRYKNTGYGGAEGIRTHDLCSAIAALSQPPDVRLVATTVT